MTSQIINVKVNTNHQYKKSSPSWKGTEQRTTPPRKLTVQLTKYKGLPVALLPQEPRIGIYDNFKVWYTWGKRDLTASSHRKWAVGLKYLWPVQIHRLAEQPTVRDITLAGYKQDLTISGSDWGHNSKISTLFLRSKKNFDSFFCLKNFMRQEQLSQDPLPCKNSTASGEVLLQIPCYINETVLVMPVTFTETLHISKLPT